jgi:hypothetical protein
MRPRWLLLAVFLMTLGPSLASARSRHPRMAPRAPDFQVGAAIDARDNTLVIAIVNAGTVPITIPIRVHSDTTQYDWLVVELSNEFVKRTFTFIEIASTRRPRP